MKKVLPLILLFSMALTLVGCQDTPTTTTKDPLSYNLPYPYIDPTDYCKIDLDFDKLSVVLDKDLQIGEEDVDEYIHKLQAEFIPDEITKTEVTDRPIKEGDLVYFYYYGTVDGQLFPESSNRDNPNPYRLDVGSNTFLRDVGVDGFDATLIGLIPNETYSDLRTEGTVEAGNVVFISGSVVYTDDDSAMYPDTIEENTRVDLANVPASFGADFASAIVGKPIGDTCEFSVTEDFDGDGKDETKTYYLYIGKAGDEQTVILTATFPKLYPEYPALAGKTASFEVVITHIEELTYPELTQSFLIQYCQYIPTTNDPVAEYRAYIRKNIEATYEPYQMQVVEGKLLDLFCENMTDLTYPDGTLVYCYEYYLAEINLLFEAEKKNYAEGTCPFSTFEQFVLLYYDLDGMTTDDVDDWIMEKCERNVKENLAVFYVGRALGFSIADSEVRRYAAATADQLNQEEATVKHTEDSILADLGWDYITCNVMYAKVMNYLLARVTVTFE